MMPVTAESGNSIVTANINICPRPEETLMPNKKEANKYAGNAARPTKIVNSILDDIHLHLTLPARASGAAASPAHKVRGVPGLVMCDFASEH